MHLMISAVERTAWFASRITFFSLSLRLSLLKILFVTEYGIREKNVSRIKDMTLQKEVFRNRDDIQFGQKIVQRVRAGIADTFGDQAALYQPPYTFLRTPG